MACQLQAGNVLNMLTKILTLILLTRAIRANILKDSVDYQKPKLERNNIVNKGVWVRNNLENKLPSGKTGDFIFRENSLDVENLLQNNFDRFDATYAENVPPVANYVKRSRRSIRRIREQGPRKSLKNCIGKACTVFGKDSAKPIDDKTTSVFNEHPFEVAIFPNNNKTDTGIPRNDTQTSTDSNKSDDVIHMPERFTFETNLKENNETVVRNVTSPKRSKKYDFESEIIKKIEFTEDINNSTIKDPSDNKLMDRNVFDKDNTVWHQNAPIPNVNVYKVVPKEPQKSKAVTERGLIKVISMLTKTFKKIMKQHHEIKDIHTRINNINEQFVKSADTITNKFQDFDVKYLYLLKFHEKLKLFDAKLATKLEYFKNKEKEMAINFKEFENQQKKFLQQQRQFYNIQKLMLAQNEKINIKQNVIAKTQSEISHRQNNFARILKKAKQLYLESRNPISKLSSNLIKTFHTPNPVPSPPDISSTTPSTESVKINLFSIPTSNKIENQDDMIIKEKDEQTIDDLVYKYYFNNTFIDNVMKNNVLTSFMGIANTPAQHRNVKAKRNELETTILFPVYENNDSEIREAGTKNRERRWINHHSRRRNRRRHRGKDGLGTIVNATDAKVDKNNAINNIPVAKDATNDAGDLKVKNDPFLTMATNFCNEIHQNVNPQKLRWCIEKSLRRLRFVGSNETIPEAPTTAVPYKPKPNKLNGNTKSKLLKNKLNTELNTIPTTVKKEPSIISLVPVTTPIASSSTTQRSSTPTNTTTSAPVNVTVPSNGAIHFPGNEELESNLKQYVIKPDIEGNVYYEGSVHTSGLKDSDSQGGLDDIMPGLESNSKVEMDPLAFDLQAQRRAIVRKLNEKIIMSLG